MRKLRPDDPRVHAAVLQKIREMPFEELVERFRAYPGWDESWLNGAPKMRKAPRVLSIRRRKAGMPAALK
jgi:hypothetical protein